MTNCGMHKQCVCTFPRADVCVCVCVCVCFALGGAFSSFDTLNEIGSAFRIARAVKDAKKDLLDKLWALEEGGQTALGPALQLAIACASSAPGSSVTLCTDGLANTGVGALEDVAVTISCLYVCECVFVVRSLN